MPLLITTYISILIACTQPCVCYSDCQALGIKLKITPSSLKKNHSQRSYNQSQTLLQTVTSGCVVQYQTRCDVPG